MDNKQKVRKPLTTCMKGTASCGYLETNTGMYQLYRYATTTEQGNQQVNWCIVQDGE